MTLECVTCKTPMTKTGTLDSGNSKFVEYSCNGCKTKKTVCDGLSTLSSV